MANPTYATRWQQAIASPRSLRSLARACALAALSRWSRSVEPRFLRCIYCHYVFDNQRAQFEQLILALKQIGRFVDTDTCVRMVRNEQPIDGRYFHLSFDDGFRNNLTNALPILQRHQVPCIFFLPSSVIDADYRAVRTYCLDTTKYSDVIEMLSWDDARSIVEQGYEIGSHTKHHVRFSEMSHDPARLHEEIVGSKAEIEAQLNAECKYIAWPYGGLDDADETALAATRQAGYQACFGAFRGTVRAGVTDPFCVPRHQVEAQWPLTHATYFARGNREAA